MLPGRRKWKLGISAAILLACVLCWNPINRAIFSIRFAWSLQKLASGASGKDLEIRETRINRTFGGREYEALVYRPANSAPTRAVILVAGLSELGCHHPSLIALSRSLADQGLMVITPNVREFREFQITAEPIDQILFWYRQAPGLEGGEKIQKIGLAGISFSATLALIAAARPEVQNKVGFVVALGPYCSLIRCTKDWFAAAPNSSETKGYPTRFYAKWIVMLSALNMVAESKDRLFLHNVLDSLLLEKKVPPADPGLTAEGERWYALATMPETQSDPELTKRIEDHLISNIYAQVDPEEVLSKISCPVFLIHGAHDDLIPTAESVELHQKIRDSHLLILPFLTHTHPTGVRLSFTQKFEAAAQTLVFCYQFSKVIL